GRGVHARIVARATNSATLDDARLAPSITPAASHAGDLSLLVGLDDVARLEVGVVLQPDTALEAFTHLTHIVLEASQRRDRALPDDRAVAQEPHLRPARDRAVGDVAPRHPTDARDAEHLPHLGLAGDHLFELGLEHSDERVADVFEDVVDDLVEAHL